ncbi:MAG: hypothetical protein HY744_24355 [Deltaproteobacteria bacterium]|nr:hypothetical protein [Deltaproteobacteria bacterium]
MSAPPASATLSAAPSTSAPRGLAGGRIGVPAWVIIAAAAAIVLAVLLQLLARRRRRPP